MKLLIALRDSELGIPEGGKVKAHLREKAKELGSKKFSGVMMYWFGGRGFNEFMDYSLLSIKLAHMFSGDGYREVWEELDFMEEVRDGIVSKLLFDDRHDMYQNVPYVLERIDKKLTKAKSIMMWKEISEFLIECLNPSGGRDISVKFGIVEDDY